MIGGLTLSGGSVEFSFRNFVPSVWSAGGALIQPRSGLAGAGTQNAGLAFGGSYQTFVSPPYAVVLLSCTEEYNGSAWSAGGAMIDARDCLAGAGTQNAGLAFGGVDGSYNSLSCTEEYNGSAWSAGGDLITPRRDLAGAGTQTAALAFGGRPYYPSQTTEEYDGTSWSAGVRLSTPRYVLAGVGTQNAGLAFGGFVSPSVLSCTEEYNGTSFSAGGSLSIARCALGGAGTQNYGIAFGGAVNNLVLKCTEEYDGSVWSAGGALINEREFLAGAGTQGNEGLAFGGEYYSTRYSYTEEYGGGSLAQGKTFEYNCVSGTTTVSCLIETSAQRYKDNIEPMGSQLSNVMRLQPVEFDWKMNKKHDIGFIAESVRDVYPNLISTNREGEVEGMNYTKLVSALVKSIQEQQEQINKLSEEINKLKK